MLTLKNLQAAARRRGYTLHLTTSGYLLQGLRAHRGGDNGMRDCFANLEGVRDELAKQPLTHKTLEARGFKNLQAAARRRGLSNLRKVKIDDGRGEPYDGFAMIINGCDQQFEDIGEVRDEVRARSL